MKNLIYFSIFITAFFISTSNDSFSGLKSVNSDSTTYCIVSGEAIDGEGVKYLYLNKEVKFCCEGCEKSFKKNPAKYLGSAELWCPVCNEGDAKKVISFVNNEIKYYFCGTGCQNKFEKNPDEYLNNFKVPTNE